MSADGFALVVARVGPLVWVGLPIASRAARSIVALALASTVLPAVAWTKIEGPLPLLLAREVIIGLVLGLVTAVPFRAAEAAGGLLDVARRPIAGGPGDTLRRAYLLLALAVFGATGGPALWIDALGESYLALPVGHAPAGGAALVVEAIGRLVLSAVELAAPALAALLVADLVIGLVARSAPSLVRGSPRHGGVGAARDLVGLAVVALTAAALAASLAGGVGALGRELAEAARTLGR